MYDYNQPILSDYNPFIKGGKRRTRKNRRKRRKTRIGRTRRYYR